MMLQPSAEWQVIAPEPTSIGQLYTGYVMPLAAFAALLSARYVPRAGERVGVLLCGANTTAVDFGKRTPENE